MKKNTQPSLLLKDLAAHPLCEAVPGGMTEEEHTALVQDLTANGMRIPIMLYQGKILDGRARYRAAVSAGVAILHEDFAGDDATARHYVMSANLHRRTLTGIQKAFAVALVYKQAVEQDGPKPSQEAMAKRYGVSKQSISLCIRAIDSKNTMLLTRLRRGEVTRGELEEEFYDHRAANAPQPVATQETGGDLFGVAPVPARGIAMPPLAPVAATSATQKGDVGTGARHPERRTQETAASVLANDFKALSETDRVSFVALAWPWLQAAVVAHQTTAKAKAKPAPAATARAKAKA